MTGLDPNVPTAENYRRFARYEAAGRSPSYEELSFAVADDDFILSFLAQLPVDKRQPNLLFAAARYLLESPPDPLSLRSLIAERPDQLSRVILFRRTQTNEAARCSRCYFQPLPRCPSRSLWWRWARPLDSPCCRTSTPTITTGTGSLVSTHRRRP